MGCDIPTSRNLIDNRYSKCHIPILRSSCAPVKATCAFVQQPGMLTNSPYPGHKNERPVLGWLTSFFFSPLSAELSTLKWHSQGRCTPREAMQRGPGSFGFPVVPMVRLDGLSVLFSSGYERPLLDTYDGSTTWQTYPDVSNIIEFPRNEVFVFPVSPRACSVWKKRKRGGGENPTFLSHKFADMI